MTILTPEPRTESRAPMHRIPVPGPLTHEMSREDADAPLYLILALLSAWGCAFMLWGLPALVLPALVAAPLVLLALVAITRG